MTITAVSATPNFPAPTHERGICYKPRPTKSGNGYVGAFELWRLGETYRFFSSQWFPVGTVLVLDRPFDIDFYPVNVEQTIAENGYTQEWLNDNEPRQPINLSLF